MKFPAFSSPLVLLVLVGICCLLVDAARSRPPNFQLRRNNAGRPLLRHHGRSSGMRRNFNPRIINGKEAKPKEFPYQVGLEIPVDGKPDEVGMCGGTLIDPTHVLTAAHCFKESSAEAVKLTKIYLNTLRLVENGKGVITRSIRKYVPHPNYNPETEENDIAIIILNKPVIGVPFARLAPKDAPSYVGKTANVIGWGDTLPNGGTSDTLLKTTLQVVDTKVCAKKENIESDIPWLVCANSPPVDSELDNDSCVGDSGGPLIVDGVQVGLVSYALGDCGKKGQESINTRISYFMDWIMANSNYGNTRQSSSRANGKN